MSFQDVVVIPRLAQQQEENSVYPSLVSRSENLRLKDAAMMICSSAETDLSPTSLLLLAI